MLTLNLLPKKQKENLGYEVSRRAVQFFGFWLSVTAAIFGILILPSFFFVSFEQAEAERTQLVEENARKTSQIAEVEDTIHNINQLLNVITDREKGRKNASAFLAEIISKAPAGVSVTVIASTSKDRHATVAGNAVTRDALLKFIDLLRGSAMIKNVSSPVSNIIQQQNVSFSLDVDINP